MSIPYIMVSRKRKEHKMKTRKEVLKIQSQKEFYRNYIQEQRNILSLISISNASLESFLEAYPEAPEFAEELWEDFDNSMNLWHEQVAYHKDAINTATEELNKLPKVTRQEYFAYIQN